MTILTTGVRVSYAADGTTRSWVIPWKYADASNIHVYTQVGDGDEVECADISVTAQTVAAPATLPLSDADTDASRQPFPSGTTVIVERMVPLTQSDEYTNQGTFFPEQIEASLDRAYMALQQMNYKVGEFWSEFRGLLTYVDAAQGYANEAKTARDAAQSLANDYIRYSFGRFRVDDNADLVCEYYGDSGQDSITINADGEVVITTGTII